MGFLGGVMNIVAKTRFLATRKSKKPGFLQLLSAVTKYFVKTRFLATLKSKKPGFSGFLRR